MSWLKGVSGLLAEVEALRAIRVAAYPADEPCFMARWTTGILAAALAADSPLCGIRNGTGAGNAVNLYIQELGIEFACVVAFTTGSQQGLYLERYNTANLAAGGTWTPLKVSDTNDNSVVVAGGAQGGEVRTAVAATLTSAGVNFVGDKVPILNWPSALLGQVVGPKIIDFAGALSKPIKLRPGEGLALRNLIVWPAAGTGVVGGYIKWKERTT